MKNETVGRGKSWQNEYDEKRKCRQQHQFKIRFKIHKYPLANIHAHMQKGLNVIGTITPLQNYGARIHPGLN